MDISLLPAEQEKHERKQFKLFHFTSANQQGALLRASTVQSHVGSEFRSFPVTAKKCANYFELILQLGIFQRGNTNNCPLHSFMKFLNHSWQHINNTSQFLNSLCLLPEVLDWFSTTLKPVCFIEINITSMFHLNIYLLYVN